MYNKIIIPQEKLNVNSFNRKGVIDGLFLPFWVLKGYPDDAFSVFIRFKGGVANVKLYTI